MRKKSLKDSLWLKVGLLALALVGIVIINLFLDSYKVKVLNLCAIYVILGLSMNLINGFTGLFSLGHAGFMAIGAYTVAILTMPLEAKEMNYYMKPMVPFLLNLNLPFIFALLIGGLLAALFGFLIGAPVLKLTDDYLAIATLGFSEIIRIVFINLQSITNGSLGLKAIPQMTNKFIALPLGLSPKTNLLWAWGMAILTIIFMQLLMKEATVRPLRQLGRTKLQPGPWGLICLSTRL